MTPGSETPVHRLPFRSAPTWDISDDEISEWKKTPGMGFAAFTAECIRDGQYDDGKEIYPRGSVVYREISREAVDRAMELLADRGMARTSGGRWYAITPGRMAPATLRAVSVLLASREDLPLALATELDAWKATLEAPGDRQGPMPTKPSAPARKAG